MGDNGAPRQVDPVERVRQAVELRKSGATFQEIADELGWNSKQAAHAAVSKALRDDVSDGVPELRVLTHLRLHDLLNSIWPNAIDAAAERPDKPSVRQSNAQHLANVRAAREIIDDLIDLQGLAGAGPVDEPPEENTIILRGPWDKYDERIKWMKTAGLTSDQVEALGRGDLAAAGLAPV